MAVKLPNRQRRGIFRSILRFGLWVFIGGGAIFGALIVYMGHYMPEVYQVDKPSKPSLPSKKKSKAEFAAKCKASDFELLSFKSSIENPCTQSACYRYKLVGELRNNCGKPAGVEIEIVGRDKSRTAVSTTTGWPASIGNIAPGATKVFDFGPQADYDERIVTFEVTIVSAKTW